MIVTQLEEVMKNRFKIYVDEEFAFVLYKGELSRYKLKENGEINQELYDLILEEVVVKRAKKRALYLLQHMARTEQQLKDKLVQNQYPDVAIDAAMAYVKKWGYIGDENYARIYVDEKKKSKSRKEIYFALQAKGIAKECLEKVLEDAYEDEGEELAIQKLVWKKKYNADEATDMERQKMYAYLMRKGFSYEDIRQIL